MVDWVVLCRVDESLPCGKAQLEEDWPLGLCLLMKPQAVLL